MNRGFGEELKRMDSRHCQIGSRDQFSSSLVLMSSCTIGAFWCIEFSLNGEFLASAGESVIHMRWVDGTSGELE